jgi:hypothetical protein
LEAKFHEQMLLQFIVKIRSHLSWWQAFANFCLDGAAIEDDERQTDRHRDTKTEGWGFSLRALFLKKWQQQEVFGK